MNKYHHKQTLATLTKPVIAFLFFFFINSLTYAQKTEQTANNTTVSDKNLYWGLKTGLNIGNFTSNIQTSKPGAVFGATANWNFLKYMGLEINALYVQNGAKHVSPDIIYTPDNIEISNMQKVNSNITLHTLNIPLLLTFNASDIPGNVKPRFFVGGFYDYYISAITMDLIHDKNFNKVLASREMENVSSSFKDYNYGITGGIGLIFKGDKLNYSIDFRYNYGLRNINNMPWYNIDNTYREDFSTQSLQILLSIYF